MRAPAWRQSMPQRMLAMLGMAVNWMAMIHPAPSPWSPAPPAASARRSRGGCMPTASTWRCTTAIRPTTCRRSPTNCNPRAPAACWCCRPSCREFDRLPELVAHTIGRFGRLDALVNNASQFFPTPFGTTTPAQWDALFASQRARAVLPGAGRGAAPARQRAARSSTSPTSTANARCASTRSTAWARPRCAHDPRAGAGTRARGARQCGRAGRDPVAGA